MRLIIPSTPALNRPVLRHFQSSPQLPLCSPAVGPSGGMQFPALRPVKTNQPGLSEVPYEMEEEEDQEPNFDIPQSREEKPAAYPNGPIQIYQSGVFLYFEPTAEQACTFDVIINVASEVKNPFTAPVAETQKDIDARRIDGPPAENPDFACLPDRIKPSSVDTQSSSPTTPKATPVLETKQPTEYVVDGKTYKTPEYIHMLWEHNTDIVPDLYKLVKTMDERVQQGKRVLVHCQCGVSRSASLIVAFGLYKNPGMSVQEAYDIVKKRSKWIGPNMNLIMQLQEFRNGLLKSTDSRSFLSQPFGRRSAGLPTGVSMANNRGSPFENDAPSGSRSPQTAPLPPENASDLSMQRASTGNMFLISPGPLSAPSGSSLFSPGCRQSWAASQTQFDLSPKSSPTTTPYVDPKGQIVPVLSITDNDRSAARPVITVEENNEPKATQDVPVLNFSRPLSLRAHESTPLERPRTSPRSTELRLPPQPLGFGALRSPAVSSFNIPEISSEHASDSPISSPIKTEFNLNPWPSSYDLKPQPAMRFNEPSTLPPPVSPMSSNFPKLGPVHNEPVQWSATLPLRAATLPLHAATSNSEASVMASESDVESVDVASPIRTEFPEDMFGTASDALDEDITSPRATEFHMTPLKPRVAEEANDDPFGLASPTRFEFPHVTPPRITEPEPRRPSVQVIRPPTHLPQPETSNGFASLNGTAKAPGPLPSLHHLKSSLDHHLKSTLDGRVDSVSTSVIPQVFAPSKENAKAPETSSRELPETPTTPSRLLPPTPRQPGTMRTRFSSPNMREQRRLQKLQTEMEAMLPNRTPAPTQTFDDLDALMSPRAEEFTRNPFHFELPVSTYDVSPVSSNETVKDGPRTEFTDARQWTPKKSLDDDPRSPVQTGSSPITRNIWDIL
jgi:tyrosine-protein phosphatase